MSRHSLLVMLLGTFAVLACNKAYAQQSAPAAETQTQAKPAPEQTDAAQANFDHAQKTTEEEQPKKDEGGKLTAVPGSKALGMSILGNQEAPTSLVIVPWKSSELGRSPENSPMLDDSRQPVDKEVFMRELHYYDIRSETKR
jgi:hypothetical protein